MNVPVEARIDQLRLSLERARHVLRDLPGRFVVVNVPAFRVFYTDEKGRWFSSRAITGKPYTSTPIFRADITQVVLNPSWTIPPGIMRRDVIPGVKRDPDYLAKKGFRKVGDQVVQPPGPNNALGRIKLNFPDPHLVYMHDTPQRNLFGEDTRAFSSGCIRVQDIEDLAVLLLGTSTAGPLAPCATSPCWRPRGLTLSWRSLAAGERQTWFGVRNGLAYRCLDLLQTPSRLQCISGSIGPVDSLLAQQGLCFFYAHQVKQKPDQQDDEGLGGH